MVNNIALENRIRFQPPKNLSSPKVSKSNPISFKAIQGNSLISFAGKQSALAKLEKAAEKLSASSGDKLDTTGGFVQATPQQAIASDLLASIKAIKEIAAANGKKVNGTIASPIENENDSSWIKNSTFYNLSPRAAGGMVNSIKLLPTFRPDCVYLAPIFENCNGALYAQSSLDLDPSVYKKDLEKLNAGLPKEDQLTPDDLMKAFVDAAHLLDKKVGMDLIPHVGDWADFLLEKPELFRWIRLNDNKDGVKVGLGVNLTNPNDKDIGVNGGKTVQDEIKDAILSALKDSGNPKLEALAEQSKDKSGPEIFTELKAKYPQHKDDIKNKVLSEVKQKKGYANVPVTPWNGTHLPEYEKWISNGNYPKFQSNGKEPYGNLTAFKFFNHKGTMKGEIDPGNPNEEAIRTFTEIFPKTREKYGLDFIRADMAKHGVDSNNGDKSQGSALRAGYATKEIWKRVIDRARDEAQAGGNKAVGAVAEAFSEDMLPFAEMGFDLTLGNDQYWVPKSGDRRGSNNQWHVDNVSQQNWIEGSIQDRIEDGVLRVKKLAEMAKAGNIKKAISQLFALDTHDCAVGDNKHRAHKADGNNGVILAMTLGLFGSSGEGKRPFYMMNGNEDGSVYQNKKGEDLTIRDDIMPLANDKSTNERYHNLFNAYEAVKDILTNKDADIPKWHNSTKGSSVFSVSSPAGQTLTVINEDSHNKCSASFAVPRELKGADKGLVILDDKNISVKPEADGKVPEKSFARTVGKKMIVNLPPAGSHVFKVVQPKDEAQWIEVAAKEVLRYAKDSSNGKILAKAMEGEHKFLPADESKGNSNLAAAILETPEKKYRLKMPLDNPQGANLQIQEL